MDESVIEHLGRCDRESKTLKLSEAMRIGSRLRPKIEGDLFRGEGSCALGAAYEGATGMTCGPNEYHTALTPFGGLWRDGLTELAKDIYRKNDHLKWSREQIADWLESQGY